MVDSTTTSDTTPQDRILRLTRLVAAIIVPFLLLAFIILFFFPGESGRRFAWEINPSMTARFMGAGYLGGSYLFIRALIGRRWHTVAPGFPPVTAFTIAMLLVTIVHWGRFDLGHFPFQLWLGLYVITPLLVPAIWLTNRRQDPGMQPGDAVVPGAARWALGILGAFLLLFAVGGFLLPEMVIAIWPWDLSLLTARILSGWFALLGVGGLVIGREARWSAWRVGLQSIAIWHVLVLAGAVLSRQDFHGGNLLNWYVIGVVLVLAGMGALYARMMGRGA